jgi:hypothetical protein
MFNSIWQLVRYSIAAYLVIFLPVFSNAQGNPPWERPLRICYGTDGITFGPPQIYQDSSGVPSAIRLPNGDLICAFQCFRAPQGSLTWDRVAVKFSYDDGTTWTSPVPIEIPDLPVNYQRPFDPTLAIADSGMIRIYFSSSDGIPQTLDSTVNTYSAISQDGIHYSFEPNARFDHPTNRVIDPAVLQFHGMWHYTCPIGAPHDGAYHAISQDGLNFTQVPDISSDMQHNWTGNLVEVDTGEMRFYGAGQSIWYKSTPNGGQWSAYVNTNIQGGDPTVVKISDSSYAMIFVGESYTVDVQENFDSRKLILFPNPASDKIYLDGLLPNESLIEIIDLSGKCLLSFKTLFKQKEIFTGNLAPGIYFLKVEEVEKVQWMKFAKQ